MSVSTAPVQPAPRRPGRRRHHLRRSDPGLGPAGSAEDIRRSLLYKLGVADGNTAPSNNKQATDTDKPANTTPPRASFSSREPLKFSHDPLAAKLKENGGGLSQLLRKSGSAVSDFAAAAAAVIADFDHDSKLPKDDDDDDEILKAKNPKPRVVSFHPAVDVAPIPHRDAYSCRISSRLWTSRSELSFNASRNMREFKFEGLEWRTCVEDDGMFKCTQTGEAIHPVHALRGSRRAQAARDHLRSSCPDLKSPPREKTRRHRRHRHRSSLDRDGEGSHDNGSCKTRHRSSLDNDGEGSPDKGSCKSRHHRRSSLHNDEVEDSHDNGSHSCSHERRETAIKMDENQFRELAQ